MSRKLFSILVPTIISYLSCLLLGYIFFGSRIFSFSSNAFVITSFGLIGVIFFSIYNYGNKKEIIFSAAMLFVANIVLLGKSLNFIYLFRDFVFITALYSSLILYSYFLRKYYYSPLFIRTVVLALIYGVFNIISTLILFTFFTPKNIELIDTIYLNSRYAIIIGLGIGLGYDIYKKYKSKFLKFTASSTS